MAKHCPTLDHSLSSLPHKCSLHWRKQWTGHPERVSLTLHGFHKIISSFPFLVPVFPGMAYTVVAYTSVSAWGFHPMLALLPRSAFFTALIATEKVFSTLLLLYKNISTEDSLGFNFKVSVLVLLEVWGAIKIWLQFWNGGKLFAPPHNLKTTYPNSSVALTHFSVNVFRKSGTQVKLLCAYTSPLLCSGIKSCICCSLL